MTRKPYLAFAAAILISTSSFAQEIVKDLPYFNKVQASSHINLVLTKGTQEHLRLEYDGLALDNINVRVKGKTLEIYLDGAKISDKTIKVYENGHKQRKSFYEGAKVTAYITFKELRGLEIRGEESAVCEYPLNAKKFKLRLYGETNVNLSDLTADKLKAKLYGENKLRINEGAILKQKYNLYGENNIETENITSRNIAINSFGENKLHLKAEEKIRIFGLGELEVVYSGNSPLRKLVIGESRIEKAI